MITVIIMNAPYCDVLSVVLTRPCVGSYPWMHMRASFVSELVPAGNTLIDTMRLMAPYPHAIYELALVLPWFLAEQRAPLHLMSLPCTPPANCCKLTVLAQTASIIDQMEDDDDV